MVIKVLVELSNKKIDKTFYYQVPSLFFDKIKVGIRVLVPFATMKLEGFVLEIVNDYNDEYELKDIIDVLDEDVILNKELILLGEYISKKTLSTLISSYQVMLPSALKAKSGYKVGLKKVCYVVIDDIIDKTLSAKQKEIIDIVQEDGKVLYKKLKEVNTSVDTLIKKGILKKIYEEDYRINNDYNGISERKILTKEQERVVMQVADNLETYQEYLLRGITGSGKTEVYMEIIAKVIERKMQAIVLVPEISLTPQIVERFKKRFRKRIAVLHSSLNDGERYDEYRKIVRDEVDIVIGARSAVFAPLKRIGVIIVDECHSDTYKQDNSPKYDAIDIAGYRCKIHSCPLIMGSATPTISQYARAVRGIYKLLLLEKRVGAKALPEINLADMKISKTVKNTCISQQLYEKMRECIARNEQIILLLNRRGYTSMLSCKNCGYTMKCPNCDISLTYHKSKELMRCHYCGYATNKIDTCPVCNSKSLRELGMGTELLEEEVKSLFPELKTLRMDFDTTSKKGSHEKITNAFASGNYQILLGTQMIAKGLDFPNVTLVGVINADISLAIPSYKSSENTFQLISQVAGRSGRGSKKGYAVIQTFNKEHYAIQYAKENDYLGFYQEEMKVRMLNKYPPYFYLLKITIKSKEYQLVSVETNKIVSVLNNNLQAIVLGPTIAYPFRVNNLCRFQIIVKYKKEEKLYDVLRMINEHYRNNDKIIIDFDFNPCD